MADTIAAIATAAGAGGVGIIRISGPDAELVLRRVAPGLPAVVESHRLTLARVVLAGQVVDQALVVLMRAPRSYTGEDVAEVHAHGGAVHLGRLLEGVLAAGARAAGPGEFTRRAFAAGRIDLTRAEAVADLVAAEGERAVRVAAAQLAGGLERRVRGLRAEVVALLAEVEATIDFPGEGLELIERGELSRRAGLVAAGARALAQSFRVGRVLRDGLEVALVGAPNAGKSSLLNALVGRERAVVSAEPGTTRDFVEARVSWAGAAVTLIDTPGEREVGGVEGRALELARVRAEQADVRVVVVDASAGAGGVGVGVGANRRQVTGDRGQAPGHEGGSGGSGGSGGGEGRAEVVVLNKCDVVGEAERALMRERVGAAVEVSALTGAGLGELVEAVLGAVGVAEGGGDETVVVTSARQAELLAGCAVAATAASEGAARGAHEELVAADLRAALVALSAVLGEGVGEDVIDAVFARFCIGK
ncbi:MAG: tRNA modification GTPase [Deltaproteobacteria bacterium]|nr:tRNA modification GTPase [Deltaproteobacteria bacterium]